jgi:hypothetical protein
MQVEDLIGQRTSAIAGFPPLAGVPTPEPEVIEDRAYLVYPAHGIEVALDEAGLIEQVMLHAEGHESHRGYRGPLPEGLSFMMSREEARHRLGTPERSGEAAVLPVLGASPPWDRFLRAGHLAHVRYADETARAIALTTLMPIERRSPGRPPPDTSTGCARCS